MAVIQNYIVKYFNREHSNVILIFYSINSNDFMLCYNSMLLVNFVFAMRVFYLKEN